MRLFATVGHVDHGKSSLLRALTGMEPDRLDEERRRGVSLDLGYVWTRLPDGETAAFVDVPGHERYVSTALAGLADISAVLFVVAADEGWRTQSTEHLAAVDAFGIRHGVLVVTRADLAEPGTTLTDARSRIARSSLGDVPAVACSARDGRGLDRLVEYLATVGAGIQAPPPDITVRLWLDRAFIVDGAGTVVTGTLSGGTVRVGQQLQLLTTRGRQAVQVRALQSVGIPCTEVRGPARVALNLRGVSHGVVHRGDVLVEPDGTTDTAEVDVALVPVPGADARANSLDQSRRPVVTLPTRPMLHVGTTSIAVHARMLGTGTARLRIGRALPLRVGDTALLREPGRREVLAGVRVLDPAPPPLRQRGAAARRHDDLVTAGPGLNPTADVNRTVLAALRLRNNGFERVVALRSAGIPISGLKVAEGWQVDSGHWQALIEAVVERSGSERLASGIAVDALVGDLGLPDRALVEPLLRAAGLTSTAGRVLPRDSQILPTLLLDAVRALEADLAEGIVGPDFARQMELGLGSREIAAAARWGMLLVLADGVVVVPGALDVAACVVAALPQPFTAGQARQALGTSRRIVIPLLEALDRRGVTCRRPDDRRLYRHAGERSGTDTRGP